MKESTGWSCFFSADKATATEPTVALLARMRDTAAQVGTIVEVHALDTPEDEARAGHLLRAVKTLHAEGEDARKALKAPHDPARPVWDAGRRREVRSLLAKAG